MPSFIACLLVVLLGSVAHAHPLDLGLLQLSGSRAEIKVSFDINPTLAATLLDETADGLKAVTVESRYQTLFKKTIGSAPLSAGIKPCEWTNLRSNLLAQTVRLAGTAHCGGGDVGQLSWSFPFLHDADIPRTFQVVAKTELGGAEHLYTAEATRDSITIETGNAPDGMAGFIKMGIEHIGAWPTEWYGPRGYHLPDGIDHILFLLGLILAGGTLWQMVQTATGFTVGHSLTLALATLGVVRLPQRFVESSIALSIAYVAVETLIMREPQRLAKSRWRVALAFGLIHGFGFASALEELHLSGAILAKALVGFNVGVEMGQVVIVAFMAPLLIALRRAPAIARIAVPGAASGIFLAGSYWFVRRAFGI
jgi:hypothetical protein